MSDVKNTGSVYDKIINEEWFSTPDMGEYQSNRVYLDSIKGLSPEIEGDGSYFYAENPPTTEAGYHSDLEVVAIKLNSKGVYNQLIKTENNYNETDFNRYDGDTLYIPMEHVYDTVTPFQLHYSQTVFNGVKHYIQESMRIPTSTLGECPSFGIRFVGINAPEIVHYGTYSCSILEDDVYEVKFKDLVSKSTNVQVKNKKTGRNETVSIDNLHFREFIESEENPTVFVERSENEVVTFFKLKFNKRDYPNYAKSDRIEFHECVDDNLERTENRLVKKLVVTAARNESAEYYTQAKKAQLVVKDAFSKAEDCIVLLDTNGLNNKKKNLPEHYLKSYERSTESPFHALYDMWNNLTGQKVPAYKYSAYRIPGQEANGRFLSAVYVKMNHNGKSIWVNLNKKVLYECNLTELAEYSNSVDDLANYSYLADGFKIWTYRHKNQIYIDHINKATADTRDDRYKIQSEIAGCNLDEMQEHTIMIGDTLFMIPPTSIKVISQTKTMKTHLLRAKGAMNKTLPKTERIIQLDLYFNEDAGINGIPYDQKLPNGQTKRYMMNGLRSLIAQFKLTPFLPIHNSYINKTLGIDAVALASYSVNTIPNYPRTLQVTLMMYEFEWIQYMPCQAVPNTDESLYTNGFSDTIYFPLLRWHYQKAIARGEELQSLNYQGMDPSHVSYVEATLGNVTALQPLDFKEPLIDFYVPREDLLDLQKQLKISLAKTPLGTNYDFSETQKKFIMKMHTVNEMYTKMKTEVQKQLYYLSNPSPEDQVIFSGHGGASTYALIKSNPLPYHANKINGKITKSQEHMHANSIEPAFLVGNEIFNFYRTGISSNTNENGETETTDALGNILLGFDMFTNVHVENGTTYFKVGMAFKLNPSYFESDSEFDLIKQYCAKQASLNKEEIFKDNKITMDFVIEFQDQSKKTPLMTKALTYLSNDTSKAIEFLSALNDSQLEDGFTDFEVTDDFEDIKDSMDTEDEFTIKFFHYDIGTPIVTNISASYNNIFANVGLKAVDGHAAQYTGGTDSTLEIEMIGDEYVAGQLQLLNRVCMDYLIRYRKILKSSPLRIDCDLTRMLGIYEVIMDSLSIDTIPETPGKFKINIRLSSADRTLRNRENLTKLKGVDNSSVERNEIINTKNYFDLKNVLGKAELYPDLELPTIKELEQAGFYFLKNKYQSERTYADPDFYFIYWYPSFAENLRTSICEYFSDPQDLNYTMEDDLFNDVFKLKINVGNKDENNELYEVLNWDQANQSYNEFVSKIRNLVETANENKEEKLSKEEVDSFTDYTADRISKFNRIQSATNALQEVIDDATNNVYQANAKATVSVKDVDILDETSTSTLEYIEKVNSNIITLLTSKLSLKIENDKWNEPESDPAQWLSRSTVTRINKQNSFLTKIFRALVDTKDVDASWDTDYIAQVVKAAAVGAMAREGLYGAGKDGVKDPFIDDEALYYPPQTIEVTNEKGVKIKVPICLYQGENELLIAHDDATRAKGVIFGKYGIKKYSAEELSAIFNRTITKPGFLDPYYNAELYEIMIGSQEGVIEKTISPEEEEKRIAKYIDGLLYDNSFIIEAHMRQMYVWLYILMKNKVLVNSPFLYCSKLLEVSKKDANEAEEIFKYLTGEDLKEEEDVTSTTGKTNKSKNKKLFKQLVGNSKELDEAEETSIETLENQLELLKDNIKDYASTLFCGLLQTLSAIAMSGLNSSVLRVVSEGNLSEYVNILSFSESVVDLSGLSEEQKKMARFVQYCNDFTEDEDDKFQKNPIMRSSYNNRVQRAYLKAANDPKTYMMHSYYDMVVNDKRGTMARAFPTYYMLLIDEGRQIGLWRLQDNFYDMNSIVEFEVVKSRKIAADTARIVMTNMYGVFTSDDEDMKDENVYTMRDVWDSIWSPKKYYQKEYVRRSNAREINRAKMQPGARVHLRMGYTSNAAELPIVFNGCVTEFEAGETMTLICQGDGVEIANPHMFNAMDGKDIQDNEHSDKFFGYKQIMELWDNLSTPRDLLVLPLAAEGSWMQEFIRKVSNGRFFNSNPFGIVHFGDRKFQTIFPTNGEVEQNIYESIGKPSFNYEKSGIITIDDGIEKEYRMDEAPRVKVKMESGQSYWDIMHIASSLTPDFICAIAPFQLRSTIFHGHPRYYYAYDYAMLNEQIVEKRKPYQQYHVYTSFSDIIDNKIATSAQDVRTNAIGYYTGPSWLAKKTEAVGPLFVDIDIFPEYQKSTSFNLGFEYKNNDILPFNIPVVDKIIDLFDWTKGPNGYTTAWRAVANGLKDCVKDMYKGELIVMGDPTVKPFDRMIISDMYEDIAGTCEVESVVHMFSTETGFTTSITPDCISAIDNKHETTSSSINQQIIIPSLVSSSLLTLTNYAFHRKNRTAYLAISSATNKGISLGQKAIQSILNVVGEERAIADAYSLGASMPKIISDFLYIDASDVKIYNTIKNITSVTKSFVNVDITNASTFIKAIDNIDNLSDILKAVDSSNLNAIKQLFSNDRYSASDAVKLLDEATVEIVKGVDKVKDAFMLSTSKLEDIQRAVISLGDDSDEIVKLSQQLGKLIKEGKDINLIEQKELLSSLKSLGKVDDFSSTGALDDIVKILKTALTSADEGLAAITKLDDIAATVLNVAKNVGSGLLKGLKATVLNFAVMLAVEIVLTKGAQEFLTRKLKNLQVLTVYPLMKDNAVWTAGLNGHQGSVYGSLSYDEPGWLEKLAISFFDYGNDASFFSGAGFLATLRDAFITTDEMREIVNGYKRGDSYSEDYQSEQKLREESINSMLESVAKANTQGYTDYKKVYITSRVKASEIKNQDEQAVLSYAKYKLPHIDNIETTKEIALNLENVITTDRQQLNKKLYEKGLLKLAYDENVSSEYFNLVTKSIMIDETNSQMVKVKQLLGNNEGVYDIPYLRPEACILFNTVVNKILSHVQPDYNNPTCEFENLKKHPIILHSATRINSNKGWRATGFLFTIEVKNYNNISNIISDIEKERDKLAQSVGKESPFSIQYESTGEFGVNAVSFFLHCPKV